MKTLFSNAFNKHLYAFVCTLFFFSGVHFEAIAQCSNGLTVAIASDLTLNGVAIPFGTPIVVTTTVSIIAVVEEP